MSWQIGDYCTVEDFKREIRTTKATDDAIIEELIRQVSREIDLFCGRHFYGVVETRYFNAINHVDGPTLFLDEDLAGVVTITLGDATTLASDEYALQPLNRLPKTTIDILASSAKWWTYVTAPDAAIAINGTWGYVAGSLPPEPVRRATLMLSRYRYEQTQAPFETQGQGDFNSMGVPAAIPESVKNILASYMKPYATA